MWWPKMSRRTSSSRWSCEDLADGSSCSATIWGAYARTGGRKRSIPLPPHMPTRWKATLVAKALMDMEANVDGVPLRQLDDVSLAERQNYVMFPSQKI